MIVSGCPCCIRLQRLLQYSGVDWHLAQPLASRSKDCIGDCRNDARSPALAHSARRLEAPHNVNLDGGRLIHAQHLISVEIALLNTTVLERNFSVERRRDAEDDRALDL